MRPSHPLCPQPADLRRQIDRLPGLPLRPSTARLILAQVDPSLSDDGPAPGPAKVAQILSCDPGWALRQGARERPSDPLRSVAESSWWPTLSGGAAEAVHRLWRHGVAAACAARRLAREADDPDPEAVARAGLLHGLGYWALAAVDPGRLAQFLAIGGPRERRRAERAWLGTDAPELGRSLAVRWGVDPTLRDAAWLHAEIGLDPEGIAAGGPRLGMIRRAHAWAERTPWALFESDLPDLEEPDPRLRLLVAEVQAHCGPAFSEPATPREERLVRALARLKLEADQRLREGAPRDRLLDALAAADPTDGPQAWSDRAARAWSGEPGVVRARVVWHDPPAELDERDAADEDQAGEPDLKIPLGTRGRPEAEVHVWTAEGGPESSVSPDRHPALVAWSAWASEVAERWRLGRGLRAAVEGHRRRAEDEPPARRAERLDALAEFAAGAGHELNNPLAVILGRAQLLLGRERDPGSARSLRAIIGQAQRAHRILRDLMYVARPPAPRPRACQPDEIVRACLRDFQEEADARGVRLLADCRDPGPPAWADPDPLRHLAEALMRNALEATPPGGTIRVRTDGDATRLSWTFQDSGLGLSASDGRRLFDPFFCGRQAGRGLGLGLPRAARFVALIGGRIRWRSVPGRGTIFRLDLPLDAPPTPVAEAAGAGPSPQEVRAGPDR